MRGLQIGYLLVPFIFILHLDQIFQVLSVIRGTRLSARRSACCSFRHGVAGAKRRASCCCPSFSPPPGTPSKRSWITLPTGTGFPKSWLRTRIISGPIVFSAGTLAFLIFLASLVAVILYRFIRVSQDEQRSNAEIAAARSVQALLIPTQLPSNRNFMLESAYLPVNGVGGDFFQVLPLKDDSLLIVVGDVSGKGLQAAMNSSTLVGALRNELSTIRQQFSRT